MEIKEYLNKCNWKLFFDNPELQEQLGKRIEFCEVDLVVDTIIIFSPVLNSSIDIRFLNIEPINNGCIDCFTGNQIEINQKVNESDNGVIIKSEKYGIIRMLPVSK